MEKKRLIALTALVVVSLLTATRAHAQGPAAQTPAASTHDPSDEDIKLFRKDLRSIKKQIIAANMDLTDTEAQQFWPCYARYAAELAKITDRKYALLKDYSTAMSSEQAESYVKGRAEVDNAIMQLRLKYFPIFRKAVSGTSTALFFQLDWRLGLIMDLQLASQTPLIEP
jgi:hypothetical protein